MEDNKDKLRQALAAANSGSLDRARAIAAEIIAADRDHPAAHHLLGLIECRSGQLESGIAHLRRASEIDPQNPAFRVMLARALVDAGRGSEAFEAATVPEGSAQSSPALWHARAEAADCVGDFAAGAEAWSKVSEFNPSDWRALSNAGQAYAGLEQWTEAAAALRSAVRLNPAEAPIRRNLVTALIHSKQLVEARREAETLLAEDPGDAVARMFLAKIHSALGNHIQSLEQYDEGVRQALARAGEDIGQGLLELGRRAEPGKAGDLEDSYDVPLLTALAGLLERTSRMKELAAFLDAASAAGFAPGTFATAAAAVALRDGDAKTAKRLVEEGDVNDDPGYVHRLKAKIEDALGNSSAAFTEATAMNRAVDDYDVWRRKSADFRARVRAMRRGAETDARVIEPAPSGPRRSPVFLVGFPRSGTTLLDTFLMGHPETAVLEEVHMLGAAERALGNAARVDRYTPFELQRARSAYFAELDRNVDSDFAGLVVDKLPLNMLGLPLIYGLFSDAKIIFAQRHPADCVLSCFMQNFILNDAMASFLDIGDSADFYDAAMDQFCNSRSRVQLAVHTLVYEHLVVEPEAAMRPLIEFLGLDWSDELLDHRATAKSRGAIITPSYDQVVKPLSKAPSGRWRRYEDEMEAVLPTLLQWAERLGYESATDEKSQPLA